MAQAASKGAEDDQARAGDDLAADIEQLKADIAELTEQLRLMREHSYGAARRAASEGMDHLRAQGEAAFESLKANADDLERQITDTVREKPITSLAVAAGIGFLFALISRR
jgi:ElaB/YqjD/DUF883 family membrane-anchored ribosome-binding protein